MSHGDRGWQLRFAWQQRLQQTKGRAVIRRMPPAKPPNTQEQAYLQRVLVKGLRPSQKLIGERVKPRLKGWFREANPRVRLDAWDDEVQGVMAEIAVVIAAVETDAETAAFLQTLANSITTLSGVEIRRRLSTSLGIDVLSSVPIEVANKARVWNTENVRLIKSIKSQYLDRVEALLLREIQAGARPDAVAALLDAEFGIGKRRAATIAHDQVNKFYSSVNRARHQDLGITRYIWSDLGDSRVRRAHRLLDGQVFRYDNPPAGGPPGHPVRCRCGEDPVIEDVLGTPRQSRARRNQTRSI